ncbi:Protein alcS [Lachnellula suecica]|uniref:Protein alcS n=1 Tax=Lachnellula suecica TaxID=602035 RepID=A0A8T9CBU2_9HELO|nr:Protein alcS [Lachnellula suecica]
MSPKMSAMSNDTEVDLEACPRSLSVTPEMFEKLYLLPRVGNNDDLVQRFGNPTPVAILGLVVALTPLSIELMGWRGASGFAATNGANYFFGGMLLVMSGVGEFLLGNTFPSVVFLAYGAHFLAIAVTYTPSFAAISAYNTNGSQTETPPFMVSFGFYFLYMGLLSLIFLICSLRTNVVFVIIFTGAFLGFLLAVGGFWSLAEGNAVTGARLLVGTGASFFVSSLAGWYLLFSIMMDVVDMPFTVPIFDLSTIIKGKGEGESERKRQGSE